MGKKQDRASGGINRLANVIDGRMQRQAYAPPSLDLGTVKKNGSLVTDTFPETVSKGEYSVLEGFRDNGKDTRVLVAWAGGEAVVVGKLAGE